VIAGTGLTGGGPLNANVTLAADLSDSLPLAGLTTGSAGVATSMSRSDHKHPQVDLSSANEVENILGLSHGGTARSIVPMAGAVVWSGADGLYVSPAGTAGQVLVSGGSGVPTWGNTILFADQPANVVYAGPVSGVDAPSAFRALVNADLPLSGVTANTYGSSTLIPSITVNSKGVVTGVTTSSVIGTLSYQGGWNASTNVPALVSSVGTNGYYYVVTTAGSTNLNGITDWVIGDWAIFNGTVWQKIDQTNTVTSVNGQTGAVSVGTVTSVAMTVPTGLSISGTPITTSGTLALTLAAGYSIPTDANQTNWTTAYTQTQQWNGGSTNLVAATGRASLGGTTVGQSMFTLVNPSAITFPRFNADNTISALDAADFRTAIGAGTSSTTGTVTSVGGTGTVNGITLTGTVTSTGNLTLGGTLSGINLTTQVSGTLPVLNGGTGTTTPALVAGSNVTISGTWPNQTINATASGGSVTTVSIVSANGFAGTVATATTTPAITLTTSISGVLKGNGTAISAATSGTDYSAGTSALATGILKSTTTTGALTIAVAGTDYQTAQSVTGIVKSSGTTRSAATSGTDFSAGTSALATGILKSTTTTGALSIAVAGTDYQTAQSVTGIVKSSGTTRSAATAGTDYVAPGGALGTPSSGTLTNCTFPTLNQSTTGTASNVTGIVAVANGGTGNANGINGGTF
jgi:hypothetical protein